MTTRRVQLELLLLGLATVAILLLDAPVNELHGTAVFYASLVRELVTGGWLSIFEGARAYFLKPPLVLWSSAASAEIFGLTNLGVSLPSRLAGIGCALLSFLIARKLFDLRVAFFATLVLITNSSFIQFSATLRMDSTLMFGGLLALFGWLSRDRSWSSAAIFGGVTLGVLSKGPLGLAPVLLIVAHALLSRQALFSVIRWRWSALLIPIFLWYGYLVSTHGWAPFTELGADLAKPANSTGHAISEIVREYVEKPLRRYLPWLPFMLVGGIAALIASFRAAHPTRATMRWLWVWWVVVFVAAAAKPDKDIRYLYLGLPVLAMFAGLSLAALEQRFNLRWLGTCLAGFALLVAVLFNVAAYRNGDTRGQIAALNKELATEQRVVAIGGYPIPPNQPRRQNTHRDWIHFYLGKEPLVLAWSQISPNDMVSGESYFLTNNRSHGARLKEYGLIAKYTTTEMVYATRP